MILHPVGCQKMTALISALFWDTTQGTVDFFTLGDGTD
jgi:hypothetical protein